MQNVDSIANVNGVDVVFLGPTDLSQSLGFPGNVGHPVVQEAMKKAFASILQSGKAAGDCGQLRKRSCPF